MAHCLSSFNSRSSSSSKIDDTFFFIRVIIKSSLFLVLNYLGVHMPECEYNNHRIVEPFAKVHEPQSAPWLRFHLFDEMRLCVLGHVINL